MNSNCESNSRGRNRMIIDSPPGLRFPSHLRCRALIQVYLSAASSIISALLSVDPSSTIIQQLGNIVCERMLSMRSARNSSSSRTGVMAKFEGIAATSRVSTMRQQYLAEPASLRKHYDHSCRKYCGDQAGPAVDAGEFDDRF